MGLAIVTAAHQNHYASDAAVGDTAHGPPPVLRAQKSFSMDDLQTLLRKNIAIEPIAGSDDEIVMDGDDAAQATPQTSALYQAVEEPLPMGEHASAPLVEEPSPADQEAAPAVVAVDAFTNPRVIPTVSGGDLNGFSPYQQQQPKLPPLHGKPRRSPPPRPTPAPTSLPVPLPQPSPGRQAYRMHIRANGHGLESFLHTMIAAMSGMVTDKVDVEPDSQVAQALQPLASGGKAKSTRPRPHRPPPPPRLDEEFDGNGPLEAIPSMTGDELERKIVVLDEPLPQEAEPKAARVRTTKPDPYAFSSTAQSLLPARSAHVDDLSYVHPPSEH